MNISLTPELEEWVQSKVKTGLYGSSSEVIRDALRLLHQFEGQRQAKLEKLRSELVLGLQQIETGRAKPMTDSLLEDIKKRGRSRADG